MKTCQRCVISGKVQGVYFRHATMEQATALGLKGWVRNLDLGDVECLICGEAEAVEKLCQWLHRGPPAAKVINVKIDPMPWEEHANFVIKRD